MKTKTPQQAESFEDITGDIGPMFPHREVAVPMYSYERPAYLFWQGFYTGLRKRGLSHAQALEELQSKGARWILDAKGDTIEALAEHIAFTEYKPVVAKA